MRETPHTGEVWTDVPGAGSTCLRFDWRAISALRGAYGKEWEPEVQRIVSELDATGLAGILEICSEHGAEWWLEKSPPFIPTAQAMQKALHLAFFGPGGEETKANPLMARLMAILSKTRSGSGSNSAGEPANFGA